MPRGTDSQQGSTSTASQGPGGSSQYGAQSQAERAREEKRSVRQNYRNLIETTENMRTSLTDHNAIDLSAILKRGHELHEKVKAPTEGILDSKFLINASEIGAQMARNLKIEAGFETEDYLKRCMDFIGGDLKTTGRNTSNDDDMEDERPANEWEWEKLGRLAAKRTRRAPTLDFLLGPLAVEDKRRKVGKRAPADRNGPVIKPQQLNEEDIVKSENETTKLVRVINDRLEEVGGTEGINFFKFIIDPKSFANTVENLFYLSFLVRDGRVSIDDENDAREPLLMSCEQPTPEDYADGKLTKNQLIMEFDMSTWKELIEVYNIKTSMIPSRDAHAGGDTWVK